MGNIYRDAIMGSIGALLILFAPLILIAIWWGSFAICRNLGLRMNGAEGRTGA
jgi:hypothetical protein